MNSREALGVALIASVSAALAAVIVLRLQEPKPVSIADREVVPVVVVTPSPNPEIEKIMREAEQARHNTDLRAKKCRIYALQQARFSLQRVQESIRLPGLAINASSKEFVERCFQVPMEELDRVLDERARVLDQHR